MQKVEKTEILSSAPYSAAEVALIEENKQYERFWSEGWPRRRSPGSCAWTSRRFDTGARDLAAARAIWQEVVIGGLG
jgi:hypothetical protein